VGDGCRSTAALQNSLCALSCSTTYPFCIINVSDNGSLSNAHWSDACTTLPGSRFLSRSWPQHPVAIPSFLEFSLGITMGLNPIAISSKSAGDVIHHIEDRSCEAGSALRYQGRATGSWRDDENVDPSPEPPHGVALGSLGP